MKNLQLFTLSRKAVNVTDEDAKHIAFVNDKVYVLRNNVLTMYEDGPGEEVTKITCSSEDVIQFEYLTQEQLLWIGAKSEFVCVNLLDKSIKRIESESIAAESEDSFDFDNAVWNPTKEAFVAIKSSGELCVFEVNFEQQVLKKKNTCNLHDELLRTEQLGWGSAARQFRSPEELALMASLKGEKPIPDEDHTVKISWRGNADQFVVNYYDNGSRKIKVFAYPCRLLDESEKVVGLQSAIAWKPSGNWIAGVVWTSKRCQLTIFEKNCLIRCSHDLEKAAYVHQLKWSPSGEVLAVHQGPNDKSYTTIDLYWFNNYSMYLKQRLQFQEVNPLIGFDFIKSPDTLCVLRATTLYEAITYSFKYVYYCSQAVTAVHTTCVAINGCKALVSRCNDSMRPSPEFDFIAEVPSPINFVTFSPSVGKIAFIDCCNLVTIFQLTEDDQLTKLQSFQLEGEPGFISPLKFHQFIWVGSRIFCVGEKTTPQTNDVDVFYLMMEDRDSENWEFCSNATLEKGFNYSGFVENHENMMLQSPVTLTVSGVRKGAAPSINLAVTNLHMRSILVNGDIYLFSLSSSNKFYINSTEVLQGVISFIIYDKYLFLSLTDARLFGVRLNPRALNEALKKNFTNVYSRLIEVGASLICGIPNTSYVAMQIPRGNIEMCSCRIIAIDRIEALLLENDWAGAVDIVRVENLNMNVLVDLNCTRFVIGMSKFINAVAVPSSLSEFLLTLEDNNIFNNTYSNCAIGTPFETNKKKNLICSAMLHEIEINSQFFINTIITACFVKDSPTAIREALQYVQSLLAQIDKDPSVINAAVEAFKSARTVKSTKEIYETALLTYDLDLILFVARNIEMDPLEFEPFIENLRSLDSCRCRFKINDFLGLYLEAFPYLVRCATDDEEVLNYVKEHKVYEQALWYVNPDTSLYVEISRIVGINLRYQSKYEESGVFFQRAKLYEEAVSSYKRGLLWKEVIEILPEMQLSVNKRHYYLCTMAEDLKNEGRIKEASEIYEKYLDDYETAIVICMEDKLFSHAIELAQKYKRNDIYEHDIIEDVYVYCASLRDRFNSMLEEFKNNKKRLVELRTEKRAQFEKEDEDVDFSEQIDPGDDIASIISSSTVHTARSTSSRASTARARRKQERKRHSMRKGSTYEDIALMESLYNLIFEAFNWGPKARELCIIILKFNKEPTPRNGIIAMCNSLSDLQKEMSCNIQEIWPPHMNNIDGNPIDTAVFKNINLLDPKYRTPPGNTMISWKLDTFPTMIVEV